MKNRMLSLHDHLKSANTDFLFFSQTVCPYCVRAAMTLKAKNFTYTEVNLDRFEGLRGEVVSKTGHRTVPVVFDLRGTEPIFVGGSDNLIDYL